MNVNISYQNSGRTAAENNYRVKDNQAQIDLYFDHSGIDYESDYHITGSTPKGDVDIFIDNSGQVKREDDFRFTGHDLIGDFDLKVDNSGSSLYENDYSLQGTVYGQPVDLYIDNSGSTRAHNDFKLTGTAPPDFLTSPFFNGIVVPTLATIPILNEAHDQTFVGPVLFNYTNGILSALKQQLLQKEQGMDSGPTQQPVI